MKPLFFTIPCFCLVLLVFFAQGLQAAPRQIFICTSSSASPTLQKAVSDFETQAANAPVIKALKMAQDASDIVPKNSEALMASDQFNNAAHNHLIVIGLLSKDSLAAKIFGQHSTIDETKRQIYAQGWGSLEGDIGVIESDRNPFLHSARIQSAPEGTVSILITGTSETGVLAALKAFEGGMLNGLVSATPARRVSTTLLDQDPMAEPVPFPLPATLPLADGAATLAGWTQPGREEYLAVLEAGGIEPTRMWRYKYLSRQILEKKPIERWLGGIHRRAFGNAINVIEFNSPTAAKAAAAQLTSQKFNNTNGLAGAKETPIATDEVIDQPYWKVIIYPIGKYVLMSTLNTAGTAQVASSIK